MTPNRLLSVAGLAIAFVWVSIWLRFRNFEPELPVEPRSLQAWSFLGCMELTIDEWGSDAVEPRNAPELLMLVPDDFDEWGRTYDTFRAWPLASSNAPDPGASYRWFTRADTLWVVWSETGTSGGVALRRFGEELSGRAGVRVGEGSVSATARAWPINCHTRLRDWGRRIEP
ncbi:MAG: hypothetical protein MJB57_03675 [Gemmatimonadetes bacterium]|nr:hypothetical protein [Gemmatimonadota bacterium]